MAPLTKVHVSVHEQGKHTSLGSAKETSRLYKLEQYATALAATRRRLQRPRLSLRSLWPTRKARPFSTVNLGGFEVACMLGRGSFGQVYIGRLAQESRGDEKNDELVAIKVMDKESLHARGQIRHTLTERRVMMECGSHPFVLKLKCAFQTASQVCLVSEYCPGGEVYFHLRRLTRFSEDTARLYAAQVLDALAYLHRRSVAYRDLKCENMLLDATGHVKLADFGLSRVGVGAFMGARTVCGSAPYMAPEVLLCHRTQRWRSPIREYGRAADWWSYGVMLYDLLVGETPFAQVNEILTFRRILNVEQVRFPSNVRLSRTARSLIHLLLQRAPTRRLGCQNVNELYMHPFFAGIDWSRLRARGYPAPIAVSSGKATWRSKNFRDEVANFDVDLTHFDVRLLLGGSQPRSGEGSEASADLDQAFANWDVHRSVDTRLELPQSPRAVSYKSGSIGAKQPPITIA
ncbi:Protein kinase, putative [Hondaea fermentalgiana]|uniref:Protein kinase, putative n=1 Tax=Hondaea fermentalgiana TaxID=2315210 RepID=A0A2R5GM79_9STRA|nr:Protein kinase, putative [Hondaea fermentalgiana]|eukprot:GBG31735.1 Protein kinase, putative [Hondaea fermentalgiana]